MEKGNQGQDHSIKTSAGNAEASDTGLINAVADRRMTEEMTEAETATGGEMTQEIGSDADRL